MSRGCLIIEACGCSRLNGKVYKVCNSHRRVAGFGAGEMAKVPELDEWLRRQEEKQK